MYYNINKHKEFFFLDLFVYFIPLSLILGNLVLNINALICISVFFTLIIKDKIIYSRLKKYFYFLYTLTIFLIINLIFSENIKLTAISIIGVIGKYLFFICLIYCFTNIKNFKKNFLRIIFILVIFVISDVIYQNFNLKDIFGYEIQGSHGRRLSGPFGDEGVAGSYIGKLFFFGALYLYSLNLGKKIILPLIVLSLVTIILTNERSASIMFFTASLIFLTFFLENNFKKFLFFVFFLISTLMILNTNNNIKSHFVDIPIKYFKDNHHKAHFLTSIEIFKDNKIVGSGLNTFREICSNEKYNEINTKYVDSRCATHPHNIYLEILSEFGILGFLTLFTINLYILIFFIKNYFNNHPKRQEIIFLFCIFFILFWPFQTTGSFFSTWNGFFYWIFFSLFFSFRKFSN